MTAASFSRAERLKNPSGFKRLMRYGKSVQASGITLYFMEREAVGPSRLGIVASRRSIRLASDRNRTKRIIREYFRLHKNRLRKGFDFIVRTSGTGAPPKASGLPQILNGLFQETGVFISKS